MRCSFVFISLGWKQFSADTFIVPVLGRGTINFRASYGRNSSTCLRLSVDKIDLLVSYVFVLTLNADDFRTFPANISRDLRMNPAIDYDNAINRVIEYVLYGGDDANNIDDDNDDNNNDHDDDNEDDDNDDNNNEHDDDNEGDVEWNFTWAFETLC
ncbi:hypothetical protein NC652_008232 [Populus alba x Populus x berolinensis]|nr:hypothetical protein NC652_008228 [Populus alba x Populus x berolinensis]KAJ6942348.1 hypothetical protein NC652_008232 [Populus alba x Populus x berolinensis]